MDNDSLQDGLARYQIGPKIRGLRLKRKMGLAQLSQHCGLSPALISKIERGRLVPTIPTLLRIATVFSRGLDYFFDPGSDKTMIAVVRRSDRISLPERPDVSTAAYYFESLNFPVNDRKIDAYVANFPSNGPSSAEHSHPGQELVYVIAGQIAVNIAEETHSLAEGDAMFFDSSVPHSYAGTGAAASQAIIATLGV